LWPLKEKIDPCFKKSFFEQCFFFTIIRQHKIYPAKVKNRFSAQLTNILV